MTDPNIGINPDSNWTALRGPHLTVTVVGFPSQRLRVVAARGVYEAVAYVHDDQPNGHVYVRAIDDFLAKYVSTDNWQEGRS